MREVGRRSGDEVVQADDVQAARQKALTQMRAEDTSAAGDNRSHARPRGRRGHHWLSLKTTGLPGHETGQAVAGMPPARACPAGEARARFRAAALLFAPALLFA